MSACECCWTYRNLYSGEDAYQLTMREHEACGCICTKPGIEGDKARAGQFWVDGRDIRKVEEETSK